MSEPTKAADGLPDVIDRYFDADRHRDHDALVALFTGDAVVFDEGEEWRGTEGVRGWRAGPVSKYDYTATILGWAAGDDDSYLVKVRLDGNFAGGTVGLRFTFSVAGDQISALSIEP